MRSYANRNQLAADPRDRAEQILEWDRRYLTVLGVANQRLYSFRLQTASDTYDKAQARPPAGCQVVSFAMSFLLAEANCELVAMQWFISSGVVLIARSVAQEVVNVKVNGQSTARECLGLGCSAPGGAV